MKTHEVKVVVKLDSDLKIITLVGLEAYRDGLIDKYKNNPDYKIVTFKFKDVLNPPNKENLKFVTKDNIIYVLRIIKSNKQPLNSDRLNKIVNFIESKYGELTLENLIKFLIDEKIIKVE